MGREAVAICRWKGEVAEVKALLERTEIILRGEIRDRIPRAAISAISADEAMLNLNVAGQALCLEIGRGEAEKWAAALCKPLPTLAEKLGVDASHKAYVIGSLDDAELARALSDAVTSDRDDAAVLVAVLTNQAELAAAIKLAQTMPQRPIWCVYGKGKFATISDCAIRTAMRGNGFMDNKSCAVSEQLTATRYRSKAA